MEAAYIPQVLNKKGVVDWWFISRPEIDFLNMQIYMLTYLVYLSPEIIKLLWIKLREKQAQAIFYP